jgi:hypothetical protein
MADLGDFDASQVDTTDTFAPLPAGEYVAAIVESDWKDTKSGTGRYLKLTLEILEGEHAGRRVWDMLNLENSNQTAVDIARKSLAGICHALGIMIPRDSSTLHDKPLRIKLAVQAASGGYEASNRVKGYLPAGGKAAPASAPAPGGKAPPPWAKK